MWFALASACTYFEARRVLSARNPTDSSTLELLRMYHVEGWYRLVGRVWLFTAVGASAKRRVAQIPKRTSWGTY